MNILFITSWYPTPKNPGSGVFIKEHARASASAGNKIVVYAFILEKKKTLLEIKKRHYTDENGIKVFEVVLYSIVKDLIYYFPSIQQVIVNQLYFKELAKSFIPDIIHSHVVFPSGIFGNLIAERLNKPHIITEHWSKLPSILSFPLIKRRITKAYKNAYKILPVSDFLKSRILHSLPMIKEDKFVIVPNVIDELIFSYQEKTIQKEEIYFTAIANWATKRQPDKKPELFIEALASVQKSLCKKIKLIMVGGGNRISELKEMCEKHQLNTEFVGFKTKQQISTILHKSDYFIHASLIETFGVVIAEALATGTPVICSNVGALPEIVNTTNGVICNNELIEWENGILKAINTPFDHRKISEELNQKYSLKNIGSKIDYVYKTTYKT